MKIGILTFHSQLNYGGVLQCWALQTALEKMGHEVVVIDRWLDAKNWRLRGDFIDYKNFSNWLLFFYYCIRTQIGDFSVLLRRIRTEKFIRRNLKLTNYHFYNWEDAPENLGVDLIVVGSDQVWRKGPEDNPIPYFLLGRNIKKIAYAISFGMRRIETEDIQLYKKALSGFSAISCREIEGGKICASLGVKAEHVLDPTLLLEPSDWNSLIRRQEKRSKTIVCYFLGKSFNDIIDVLDNYASENSIQILLFANEIQHISTKKTKKCRWMLWADPQIFIKEISRADGVITDSFHGVMFSIIFRVNVRVVKPYDSVRKGMFARIEEISSLFFKSSIIVDSVQEAIISLKEIIEINANALDEYREQSLSFIEKSIKSTQ